jgi:hypothetical protein
MKRGGRAAWVMGLGWGREGGWAAGSGGRPRGERRLQAVQRLVGIGRESELSSELLISPIHEASHTSHPRLYEWLTLQTMRTAPPSASTT